MESQREVERRYSALLKSVKEDDFYKSDLTNRVNCYKCSCGHVTKTRDIDPGVTPFMHNCEACTSMATSTFYSDVVPNQEPTQEWYRPTLKQTLKMRNKPSLLEHILNGGLALRYIV